MANILMRARKIYKLAIVIVDLVLIYISYIFAFLIKFKGMLPAYNFMPFLNAAPYIMVAAIVYIDIYKVLTFYRKSAYDVLKSLFYVIGLLCITTISITFMMQGFSFPRTILVIVPVFQFFLLGSFNLFLLYIRRKLLSHKTIMIIRASKDANLIVEKINTFLKNEEIDKSLILDISQERIIMRRLKDMDEVYLDADVPARLKADVINQCIGRKQIIYVVPQVFEISLINAKLMQLEDTPAFMVGILGLTSEQMFFKRLFDLVVSTIGLILLSPFLLVISALIKLTSAGPILYKQERTTKGSRTFLVYKFRTMVNDAEMLTGPVLSEANDPRVTRIGKIMRKLRIDELPQLLNVIKGEMSLVGPRPERPYFVEQIAQDLPEYNHRFIVKAGITGYAQIHGNYSTSPEDKLRYDLLYIRNYSLLLDIKLIFRTFGVVFTPGSVSKVSRSASQRVSTETREAPQANKHAI